MELGEVDLQAGRPILAARKAALTGTRRRLTDAELPNECGSEVQTCAPTALQPRTRRRTPINDYRTHNFHPRCWREHSLRLPGRGWTAPHDLRATRRRHGG